MTKLPEEEICLAKPELDGNLPLAVQSPESFQSIFPKARDMADQEFDLFLSYATEDREWATMLAERLRSSGVRVWFDVWELQPGDHIKMRYTLL